MYSKGSLVLSEAVPDDIPTLSKMFPRSFHNDPYHKKMIPDTPANDNWWQESHRRAIRDPKTRLVKVTDEDTGEIVATARWVLPRDDDGPQPALEEERWPEFTDDFDHELANALFGGMGEHRTTFMGDRKHYCG